MKRALLCILMAFCLASEAPGDAQSGPQTHPENAGQQKTAMPDPASFLNAALGILAAVDRYEIGKVWDVSSPIMKASIPKDRFVANLAQRRAVLGMVRSRDWTSIMRVLIGQSGGPLPKGEYISVRFVTTGENETKREEIVSFNHDTDGQWKLAGYTIQ